MAYPKGGPHPKTVGDRSTAQVLAKLLEICDLVWIPFGENHRSDLLVQHGNEFLRVQCKTGRLIKGAIVFQTCSQNYHHPNRDKGKPYRRNYRGQAEIFGVYCPDTNGVSLVPVDLVGVRACSLRLHEPASGQRKGIRWASDFEASTLSLSLASAKRPPEGVP